MSKNQNAFAFAVLCAMTTTAMAAPVTGSSAPIAPTAAQLSAKPCTGDTGVVVGIGGQKSRNGPDTVTITALSDSPDRRQVAFTLTPTEVSAAGIKAGKTICLKW